MSMRTMFAGRDPSTFAPGTVNPTSIVDPRRAAVSTGAAGVSTRGGRGGPFCPHAENTETTTINAEIAAIAEKTNPLGDRCDLGVVRRDLTEYNEKDPRS